MLGISVPASTSNLGCGFDAFGLALNLRNEFLVEEWESFRVYIEGEGEHLPRDENNLFIKAYLKACQRLRVEAKPLKVVQKNRVPTARGLGSSATAIIGGITACEIIHGKSMSHQEKLRIALSLEPHPDNLTPALVGGFVISLLDEDKVIYTKLDFPEDIKLVVAVPDFELSTHEARKVLKQMVSLSDAVGNVQRASLMIASLCQKRYELLKEAVKDRLHQPHRAKLIPGFYRVLERAYEEGALAVFLSGAGPSIASFSTENFDSIGEAMVKAFEEEGVSAKYLVLDVSNEGTKVYQSFDS
ncbi:MAG: homoserine kinase [Hydrogenobacter thermophilus]|uniref:homoserine kinase n=1 Tax=Hydrogenobacter thermophilus TaxID=940 RepID=UPI001C77D0AA|nr:homoserine kinase [Hydrogenobacter thermophilus]QWK18992.1 MAG: homoserine kinase [Hydrogenobacter thermophilus]